MRATGNVRQLQSDAARRLDAAFAVAQAHRAAVSHLENSEKDDD